MRILTNRLSLTVPPLPATISRPGSWGLTRLFSRTSSDFDDSEDDEEYKEGQVLHHPAPTPSPSKTPALQTASTMVDRYLSTLITELADRGFYSEDLMDFLAIDEFARKRLHCDDVKLFLRELHEAEAEDSDDVTEDFAVAMDWQESWLAFLRSETNYYGPPGPVKNKDLAAIMAQHAVHRDGDISDEYALHSPAKWNFVTTVYGPPDLVLRLPRRRSMAVL